MADKTPEALPSFPHFGTIAIHDGQEPEQWYSRAVVPLISMSTTFKQDSPGQHRKAISWWGKCPTSCPHGSAALDSTSKLLKSLVKKQKMHVPAVCSFKGFEYSRSDNPTRQCFEKCVAGLEGAKYAFATSSGLAASMIVAHLMKSGDHIACVDDVYGGTNRYFNQIMSDAMGIEVTMNDFTDLKNVNNAIKPNTKVVWIETPTNPLLKLIDIKAVADMVHEHEGVILVVDNTFMSSYFQRPLSLGADVVMHSVTKYMNGHGDVVMGVLATNDDKIAERIKFLQNATGPVPSPFDSYLANRGLKTLHLRMRQHEINAMAVAKFLEKDSRCCKVLYPGLESHPQHELAKRQMTGFGGMVTFFIKGGLANAKEFLKKVKIFTLAESLGGFESLCEHPAIMTHASVPPDQREKLGISDTMIRLSVGLEDMQDILDDIDQALAAAMLVKN